MNEPTADFDAREFRNALGCFATGVTVITTLGPRREMIGITANSFSSVSLDPPLILFTLGRHAYSLKAFLAAGDFAVNVLRREQKELSGRFAVALGDKWAGIDYEVWESGCPILPGSLASFECRNRTTHDGGDHVIFVGEVQRMRCDRDGQPLVFLRGGYGGYAPLPDEN